MTCSIIGVGGYLPGNAVSNDELGKVVDSNDEWIRSRTGITQRYFTELPLVDLAYQASLDAIANARIDKKQIDCIIVCTTTPDTSFPSTATLLQGKLDLHEIPSFDLNAVCSGFVYGLEISNALMSSTKYKNILLVGADKMSSVLDMSKRSTAVLFGDGAGAVILKNSKNAKFHSIIASEGSLSSILYTKKNDDNKNIIHMSGSDVYRNAIKKMSEISLRVLYESALSVADVDFFIPHQANVRILDAVAEKIGISLDKVVSTVKIHANTSAATIPLGLNSLKLENKLKAGNKLLMSALGAGVTYGGAIIEVNDEYDN